MPKHGVLRAEPLTVGRTLGHTPRPPNDFEARPYFPSPTKPNALVHHATLNTKRDVSAEARPHAPLQPYHRPKPRKDDFADTHSTLHRTGQLLACA